MTYQLPPVADAAQFEKLVRDILRRVYRDPSIEIFGRKGQAQDGIDGFSPTSNITFQCKLKDTRFAPDSQLQAKLLAELEDELSKTQDLVSAPTRFVFASTYKNDKALQEKALSLSSDRTAVEYWGWDTINDRIWEFAEELVPLYYPKIPIRGVSGFRQVTPQLIAEARRINVQEKNLLALDYYRINDRAEVVFQIVCNDMDVRNTRVMDSIQHRLQMLSISTTVWVVGAGGSGKTTILNRAAVELAEQGRAVFTLDCENFERSNLESVLSLLKYCSVPDGCVLCIDNPAADDETLETLLRKLPDYTSNVHVILAERAHRYKTLRRTGTLTYLHGEEDHEPIYVRNPQSQREDVYNRLFDLLEVSNQDRIPLLDIVRNENLVYVNATYSILLELKKKRLIDFDFDWDDYRKSTLDLPSFAEGYKYIALFYLFGVRTPFSTFSRICGAGESEQQLFLERFRGLVNEPIVVDERRDESFRRVTHLRTKHEIVSEIFFGEHPTINREELLMQWAESTDFQNANETQALVNIFGAKKNYLSEASKVHLEALTDFFLTGYINEKVQLSPKLYATLHLAKCWLLVSQNRTNDAIAVLLSLISVQPNNLHCRIELAKVNRRLGDLDAAENILLNTLSIDANDVHAYTELSTIYQKQGKFSEAESLMLKVLQIKPHDLNARTELARIFQKAGKLAEAEQLLLQVLDLRRHDLNSRTELAKVYRRQGRLHEAEAVLLELLKMERRSIWARTELAKVYQRQNRLNEAERFLVEVLEIVPNDLNSRTELAKIYQRQDKLKEAEEVLMELLRLEPNDLQARTELAKIYQRQGKLKEAEERLLESLAIDDKQFHPRTELAKIYQRQGKFKEAEERLLESLAIDDRQLHPRTELAKIYQRQGKLKEAEERLLESLAIDDKQLHPRTELAKIYQRQGKLKEAEERLRESLAIDDKQTHPRTELAKIYQRQGKLKEAEEVLMDSLRLEPNDFRARTELAKIYQRQNRLNEAEGFLVEVLQIVPNDLNSRTELAKIYQRQGKLKEAEERLLESLAIDDKQLHPRTELAKIYQRQGKLKEAEERLLESLAIDDKQLHPRTELAKVYQRQGNLDEAAKYAEQSLSIDPLNDHAMSELIAIWTRQNEGEKCAKRFMEFIEQPRYRFTRSSQAPVFRFFRCCERFGMADHARTVFERFRTQLDDTNVQFFQKAFHKP
jgi:tetratricopeptide (TPR) repeat protein